MLAGVLELLTAFRVKFFLALQCTIYVHRLHDMVSLMKLLFLFFTSIKAGSEIGTSFVHRKTQDTTVKRVVFKTKMEIDVSAFAS